jgi:hypothetical protein
MSTGALKQRTQKLSFTTIALIIHHGTPSEWYIRTKRGAYYRIKIWASEYFLPDIPGRYVIPSEKRVGGIFRHRGFDRLTKKEMAQLLLSE